MQTAKFNTAGACPFCGGSSYTSVEERNEGQDRMQCTGCGLWSVRVKRTKYQYPLQKPTDKNAIPVVTSRFE